MRTLPIRARSFPIAMAALLLTAGCGGPGPGKAWVPPCDDVRAELGSIASKVAARGRVEPRDTVRVRAAAEGRVTELLVRKGDEVREGQALARVTLDSKIQLNFTQAMLNLKSARLKRRSLEEQVARSQQLLAEGLMSRVQVEELESTLEETVLKEQVALERIREIEQITGRKIDLEVSREQFPDVSKTVLRAPMAGTVMEVLAQPGETVNPSRKTGSVLSGGAVLALADLTGYRLVARVSELDVNRIEEGQPVILDFDSMPGEPLRGTVQRVAPFGSGEPGGEPGSGRYGLSHFEVQLSLDEAPAGVRPGLSFRASFIVDEAAGIVTLPIQAVVSDGTGEFVLAREGDGYGRRTVVTGISDDFRVQILEGLDQGAGVCGRPLAWMEAVERAQKQEGSGLLDRLFKSGDGDR